MIASLDRRDNECTVRQCSEAWWKEELIGSCFQPLEGDLREIIMYMTIDVCSVPCYEESWRYANCQWST